MNQKLPPLEQRVQRSLARLGYPDIEVTDLGDGKIKVSGKVATPNERVMIVAASRSVAGVDSVKADIQTTN